MAPRTNEEMANMEIIRINGKTYMKEPFGPNSYGIVEEMNTAGKTVDIWQTTLLRKPEPKRFYF